MIVPDFDVGQIAHNLNLKTLLKKYTISFSKDDKQ